MKYKIQENNKRDLGLQIIFCEDTPNPKFTADSELCNNWNKSKPKIEHWWSRNGLGLICCSGT